MQVGRYSTAERTNHLNAQRLPTAFTRKWTVCNSMRAPKPFASAVSVVGLLACALSPMARAAMKKPAVTKKAVANTSLANTSTVLFVAPAAHWDLNTFAGYEATKHGCGEVTFYFPNGLPKLSQQKTATRSQHSRRPCRTKLTHLPRRASRRQLA